MTVVKNRQIFSIFAANIGESAKNWTSPYSSQNKTFDFLKKYRSIKFFYGDGYEGLPTYAPFDRVLITAAAPVIPQKLIDQLKPGGMMVIPVGMGDVQRMMRITKLSGVSGGENDVLKEEVFDNFSFVPMLEGKNN